ncbi:MAG: hypothetical protein A3H14_02505 [Candidatus Doudnabacteria bacterium RIFCSPLOWO2_12_FULL_49_8]|nr:MAG: hypothetical protein A3H14_02505 [Candidatus Doudnabacteria bacterium RIFCSPLOWO2_12_FULL_49_8]
MFTNSVSANPTDTVEFRIQVNAGNGAVNNVSVSDSLPTRLNYINNSLTVDGSNVGNNLSGIGLGNVSAGQTKTILFRATVADSSQFSVGNTLLTNTANATSSANSTSASASVTVGVVQSNTALSINKLARNVTAGQSGFVKNTNASPGDTIQFQIQVSVSGNAAAQNVNVNDILPGQMTVSSGATTFNLGTINAGATQTLTLSATLAGENSFSCGSITLTNTAQAQATNASLASDTATVTVTRTNNCSSAGNISMAKLVRNITQGQSVFTNNVSANPSDLVEFQIQMTVQGGTVNNVSVSDFLPARLNYSNNSLTLDGSSAGNNLSAIGLGNISVGQTRTILFRATVADSSQFSVGNTLLTNTANATSSANSATASANITVNGTQANASLTMVKLARNVTQGQNVFVKSISANPSDQIQFQIQVTANGSQAQNVNVTDNLPGNMFLNSGSTNFNLGTMNAGSSQIVTLTATISGSGNFNCNSATLTNTAFANSSNSNSTSDTASIFVNATGSCIQNNQVTLSLTKEVRNLTTNNGFFTSSVSANNGDQVQFRLTVRNNNLTTSANNVRLTDSLPAGLTYVPGSFQVDGGSASGSLFGSTEFLGSLSPSQSRTIMFNATVNATAGQIMTNVANAAADNANSVSGQATVTVSGTVLGGNVALVQSKRAFNQTRNADAITVVAQPGDIIVYTLSVTNQGNTPAANYVFQDDISDVLQLSQLQDFSDGTFNLGALSLSWPAVTISPGVTVTKTFTVKVNSSFASGLDNVMTNTFGNTVNVQVNKPTVAGAFISPKTGPTTNLSLLFAFLTVGAFVARKQKSQLKIVGQKLIGLVS